MRADREFAYGVTLGFLADLVAGDPRRGHPVAAFGRAAGALERRLWRDDRGTGAVFTALCVGGTVGAAALARRAAVRSSAASLANVGLTAAATWSVLGGTSLAREARGIAAALEAGDIEGARALLPRLCGRDPQALDADGIARAVVESVAENTSDAVVGALVWGGLCGVPGLVGFRAVNTLDAMVGHRSARYARFGWASARLDDVVGWPGARLTAALAVLAGPAPGCAWRTWRRDGKRHPSPNAGPVEAAFAGALRVRLGGELAYGGRVEHRPVLGGEFAPPRPADIARAIRLSRRINALTLTTTLLTSAALPNPPRAARASTSRLRATAPDIGERLTHATPSAASNGAPPNPPRRRDAGPTGPAVPSPPRAARASTSWLRATTPYMGERHTHTPPMPGSNTAPLNPPQRRDAEPTGPAVPSPAQPTRPSTHRRNGTSWLRAAAADMGERLTRTRLGAAAAAAEKIGAGVARNQKERGR